MDLWVPKEVKKNDDSKDEAKLGYKSPLKYDQEYEFLELEIHSNIKVESHLLVQMQMNIRLHFSAKVNLYLNTVLIHC